MNNIENVHYKSIFRKIFKSLIFITASLSILCCGEKGAKIVGLNISKIEKFESLSNIASIIMSQEQKVSTDRALSQISFVKNKSIPLFRINDVNSSCSLILGDADSDIKDKLFITTGNNVVYLNCKLDQGEEINQRIVKFIIKNKEGKIELEKDVIVSVTEKFIPVKDFSIEPKNVDNLSGNIIPAKINNTQLGCIVYPSYATTQYKVSYRLSKDIKGVSISDNGVISISPLEAKHNQKFCVIASLVENRGKTIEKKFLFKIGKRKAKKLIDDNQSVLKTFTVIQNRETEKKISIDLDCDDEISKIEPIDGTNIVISNLRYASSKKIAFFNIKGTSILPKNSDGLIIETTYGNKFKVKVEVVAKEYLVKDLYELRMLLSSLSDDDRNTLLENCKIEEVFNGNYVLYTFEDLNFQLTQKALEKICTMIDQMSYDMNSDHHFYNKIDDKISLVYFIKKNCQNIDNFQPLATAYSYYFCPFLLKLLIDIKNDRLVEKFLSTIEYKHFSASAFSGNEIIELFQGTNIQLTNEDLRKICGMIGVQQYITDKELFANFYRKNCQKVTHFAPLGAKTVYHLKDTVIGGPYDIVDNLPV